MATIDQWQPAAPISWTTSFSLNDAEGTYSSVAVLRKLNTLFIFTGLQWMFLHYGPYDTAWSRIIETASGNTAYVASRATMTSVNR